MAKFKIKDGVAIIPEGTTEIGNSAFQDCSRLLLLAVFSDAPPRPPHTEHRTGLISDI